MESNINVLNYLKKRNDLIISQNTNNKVILKKHQLIKTILNSDHPFLKMDIETAYSILKDLGIKEEDMHNTYVMLMALKD